MGRLAGKVAVVSGAGSIGPGWGNGKAAATLFAREGARVAALDISLTAAQETAAIIESEGGQCLPIACDVSKSNEVKDAITRTIAAYERIDVLHNNVGLARAMPTADISDEEWDFVFAVNLKGIFLMCREVLPVMERQGKGAIVNVSSVAGIRYARIPYATYSTTKGAILPFTRTIALEYATRGIRANCVLPGLLDTPMAFASLSGSYEDDRRRMVEERSRQVPIGRMGDAWDVAYAALFLASDEAKFITGAELVIDGGMSCSTG